MKLSPLPELMISFGIYSVGLSPSDTVSAPFLHVFIKFALHNVER